MNGFELAGRSLKVGRPDGSGSGLGSGTGVGGVASDAATGSHAALGGGGGQGNGPGGFGSAVGPGGGSAGLPSSQQVTGMQAKIQAQALIQAALGNGNGAMVAAGMIAPVGKMAAASAAVATGGGSKGVPMKGDARNRIYVGSVSVDLTCDTIKAVFDPFGKITEVRLLPEPGAPGKHRGYGFIQYEEYKPAQVGLLLR